MASSSSASPRLSMAKGACAECLEVTATPWAQAHRPLDGLARRRRLGLSRDLSVVLCSPRGWHVIFGVKPSASCFRATFGDPDCIFLTGCAFMTFYALEASLLDRALRRTFGCRRWDCSGHQVLALLAPRGDRAPGGTSPLCYINLGGFEHWGAAARRSHASRQSAPGGAAVAGFRPQRGERAIWSSRLPSCEVLARWRLGFWRAAAEFVRLGDFACGSPVASPLAGQIGRRAVSARRAICVGMPASTSSSAQSAAVDPNAPLASSCRWSTLARSPLMFAWRSATSTSASSVRAPFEGEYASPPFMIVRP